MKKNRNKRDSSDRRRVLKEKACIRMCMKDEKLGKGYIKNTGIPLPAFFQICERNIKTQRTNALRIRHPNVLTCYAVRRKKDKTIFAYENFVKTLEDICSETGRFWEFDQNNRIIGMTAFFQKMCVVLIKVLFSLNSKDKSHQRVGILRNVIFCEDDVPKLRNDSDYSIAGETGLQTDLSGLASLIDQIVENTTSGYTDIPVEVISFKSLLQGYQPKSMDIDDLKLHPVFFTPEKRKFFMYAVVEHLKKSQLNWRAYEARLLNVPGHFPLDVWVNKACTVNCFLKGLRLCYNNGHHVYQDTARSLVFFVRNTFSHINENCGSVEITDKFLSDSFLSLFPNLFVELYGHKRRIPYSLLAY